MSSTEFIGKLIDKSEDALIVGQGTKCVSSHWFSLSVNSRLLCRFSMCCGSPIAVALNLMPALVRLWLDVL